MHEVRVLESHDGPTSEWALLAPDAAPAVVGGAIDWQCPTCHSLLAQSVAERQFLDLLICCPTCGTIGGTPTRQPGEPLAGPSLTFSPGRYRLGAPVDLADRPLMCVGSQAANGFFAETGYHSLSSEPAIHRPIDHSRSWLRAVAMEAIELLGPRYSELREADIRGQSSPTPPSSRHRLVALIEYGEEVANLLDEADGQQDVFVHAAPLVELWGITNLFKRWRRHPAYPYLAETLVSGSEVEHTFMLLAVASYLTDSGNGVGIVFDQLGHRIPDIWVVPNVTERLDLEVKTPRKLQGPLPKPIPRNEAKSLIERQLKRAASGKGRQLSGGCGMLAIGGFYLGPDNLSMLCDVGSHVLASQSSRKPHLIALAFSDLSYEAVMVNGSYRPSINPTIQTRIVRHPGYKGSLRIDDYGEPWQVLSPTVGLPSTA